MATDTHPVTPTGVIEAVAALGPLISGHAERAERGRRLAPEVLEALDSAGVFRLTAPRAQGGTQATLAEQVEVSRLIATACGSTGWVAVIYIATAYFVPLFHEQAQQDIYATPGARISATLIPSVTAAPAHGGYVLNGRSPFSTGCLDAQWHLMGTTRRTRRPKAPGPGAWSAMSAGSPGTSPILPGWRAEGRHCGSARRRSASCGTSGRSTSTVSLPPRPTLSCTAASWPVSNPTRLSCDPLM
ncbi:MAG: hypothetical protein JWL99_3221 [Streptomyces oryziradicis]|nr:hypothetical protein [Actinacidiphila oryziradicis]